jgi:hypothetical protein
METMYVQMLQEDFKRGRTKGGTIYPLIIKASEPTEKRPFDWFAFNTEKKKTFIPFGICKRDKNIKNKYPINSIDFDTSGEVLCVDKNLHLNLEISMEGNKSLTSTYEIKAAANNIGVYWFASVSCHIEGTMILTFSCPENSKILPFQLKIKSESNNISKNENENNSDNKNKINIDIGNSSRVKSIVANISNSGSKKLAKRQIKEVNNENFVPLKKAVTSTGIGQNQIFESSQQSKLVKPTLIEEKEEENSLQNSHNINDYDKILPYPIFPVLSSKYRLTRNADILTISGHGMDVSLPPSLMTALLDDRIRVNSVVIIPSEHSFRLNPTVNELLQTCQEGNRLRLIADSENYIQELKFGFDTMLESRILYSSERSVFKKSIIQWRSEGIHLGDVFGSVHLLRHLILVLKGMCQIQEKQAADASTEEIKIDNSPTKSSQSRRTALSTRHAISSFFKMKEVIVEILKELNDNSHYLF